MNIFPNQFCACIICFFSLYRSKYKTQTKKCEQFNYKQQQQKQQKGDQIDSQQVISTLETEMSGLVLSGLTTITTIHLFDGWDQIADIFDDVRNVGCWINSQLPDNKFIRASIYVAGTVVLLRAVPFILRRTSFFAYHETEMIYFHRSCNQRDVVNMKQELLKELTDIPEEKIDVKFLPRFGVDQKLIILEINAGSGTNSIYYPTGSHIIATDSREEEKEKIENNFMFQENDEGQKNLHLSAYIHTIPEELAGVPDSSVSCVVSFHSLCNARKKDRALDEIHRVLMPGGRFYFIEHTTVKERYTLLWLAQLNFRPTMFMLSCCIDTPETYLERSTFSKLSFKRKDVDMSRMMGPLKCLVPHIYGYAVK